MRHIRTIGAALILAAAIAAGPLACQQDNQTDTDRNSRGVYVYTLREGDESYEDVSRRVYETDKYAELISTSNPDIAESEFKPGLKITIPQVQNLSPIHCDWQRLYY
ncbi:MAG: hypothetical protein ACLFUJ_13760 [Phycisphaerae bacterium]